MPKSRNNFNIFCRIVYSDHAELPELHFTEE